MPTDTLLVFLLLGVTVVLFASNRVRLDLVAVMVILVLMVSGVLSPSDALSGFGDPVVLLIAGLFVVSEALFRTGVAHSMGNWLVSTAGGGEVRLLVALMLVVAVLSAFMSSTGAVAIFIPVALNLARKSGIHASRLLMPIAIASLIGGMLTLIGTPPNLVVSTELERNGLDSFGFFAFTPVGLLILVAGILYVTFAGRRMLRPPQVGDETATQSGRSFLELTEAYGISNRVHVLRVQPASPLAGETVASADLRVRFGITVGAIVRPTGRRSHHVESAMPHREILAGDELVLLSEYGKTDRIPTELYLEEFTWDEWWRSRIAQDLGLVEVLLTPDSQLIGKTIREVPFRTRHRLIVLAVKRMGKRLDGDPLDVPLQFGDTLLMTGGWEDVRRLQSDVHNFMVMGLPVELDDVAPNRRKAPVAIVIILGMLGLMTFKVFPAVTAVLLAALALVLTRCLSMKDVYSAMSWESLILIAGMLPMATALQQTGGVELIVDGLLSVLGSQGPFALLAGLFILTATLSLFISNTATTVLIAPVAMAVASDLGVSPYTFMITVAIAASTAFSTPVASPVNTLVMASGGYRFMDFVKIGVPLQLIAMLITLVAVPIVFPLN
jgi:di/tricarboxylate transporter